VLWALAGLEKVDLWALAGLERIQHFQGRWSRLGRRKFKLLSGICRVLRVLLDWNRFKVHSVLWNHDNLHIHMFNCGFLQIWTLISNTISRSRGENAISQWRKITSLLRGFWRLSWELVCQCPCWGIPIVSHWFVSQLVLS
jgi:hypothetical protein